MADPLDKGTADAIRAFRQKINDKNTAAGNTFQPGYSADQSANNGQLNERVQLGNDLAAGDPNAQANYYGKMADQNELAGGNGGYEPGSSREKWLQVAVGNNPLSKRLEGLQGAANTPGYVPSGTDSPSLQGLNAAVVNGPTSALVPGSAETPPWSPLAGNTTGSSGLPAGAPPPLPSTGATSPTGDTGTTIAPQAPTTAAAAQTPVAPATGAQQPIASPRMPRRRASLKTGSNSLAGLQAAAK